MVFGALLPIGVANTWGAVRSQYLPYCSPQVGELEVAFLQRCIGSTWLTSGPRVAELENTFARITGVEYAVAVNSCTAALHTGLIALGIGPGDEVIIPALTFVAAAQCVLATGATPVLCDVDRETLSISIETISAAISPKTRAIMPMHYAGRPVGIESIMQLARDRSIVVLEDAAHAGGMLDNGRWAGTRSHGAAYSFYSTKNITTGEGGMFVTNDAKVAQRVRRLALHGIDHHVWDRTMLSSPWRYDVVEMGFKYNMPDVAAAIGLAQIARLDSMQKRREEISARYLEGLEDIPGLRAVTRFLRDPDRHSWCMFVIEVDPDVLGLTRDQLSDALHRHKIGTSVHYIPIHSFSAYRTIARADLSVTEAVSQHLLSLPAYPALSDADVEDVISALKAVCRNGRPALGRNEYVGSYGKRSGS